MPAESIKIHAAGRSLALRNGELRARQSMLPLVTERGKLEASAGSGGSSRRAGDARSRDAAPSWGGGGGGGGLNDGEDGEEGTGVATRDVQSA